MLRYVQLSVKNSLLCHSVSFLPFRSLRPQPREGTFFSHCAFARYVARKNMAAKKNVRAEKADDIMDVPIPPHEEVINLILLFGIVQEFQYTIIKTFRVCRRIRSAKYR